MNDITTHVLDTSLGRPAENMVVTLAVWARDEWHKLGEGRTDIEGQIRDLLPTPLQEEGMYRLRFAVADYYAHINTPTFYPFIDIVFDVLPGLRYHVPLQVSPFGYSTYRGS
jgi:5-hydroxyisourate hydrolase